MINLLKFLSIISVGNKILQQNIENSVSASTCLQSSYDTVLNCYQNYFSNFNLTIGSEKIFPDYQTFVVRRAKLQISSNVTEFKNICNFQNKLTSCLGDAANCINPQDLLKIGTFNNNDNYHYAGDYAMSKYECTEAYNYILNNFNCLSSISFLGHDMITKCTNDLEKNIPTKGECSALNDYTNCLDNIYLSFCGNKAADFSCNILMITYNIEIPFCNGKFLKCNPLKD
ncbi:Hypothetical protein SRAE_0000003300 [Strongyloides ratti]|uniref:DUF19 domain-containing protein n=1 Tax=Strongyloides ratti TaxID=34506 RepID=A0A090KU03_STRRB|nr:Hypothetical protein SRAE_0000003300 [Strongyloides ratti]CEF60901.1 Hypothetical protein SRAE_0000003300 [Strongyloides ratti]